MGYLNASFIRRGVSLTSRPPHLLRYTWWGMIDTLWPWAHLGLHLFSVEEASMITYSSHVCGHLRDMSLAPCTFVFGRYALVYLENLSFEYGLLIERVHPRSGWFTDVWNDDFAPHQQYAPRTICSATGYCNFVLPLGKFRGRNYPKWGRL